jgi:hypothetical protein
MPCSYCNTEKTYTAPAGQHIGEYCAACHRWLRWVAQSIDQFIWPIGAKHKGTPILHIAKTDRPYLEWAAQNISSPKLRERAREALNHVDM